MGSAVLKASDPVTAYARDVVSGKIPAGKLQVLACKRHLDDLKRFDSRPIDAKETWKPKTDFYWDLEFALGKLSFFPQLRHWRGRIAGEPFELMGWQTFCTGSLFGWFKRDETYRFETAMISVPKKSGKSLWVGAVGLLRGFYDDENGSEVYSIATTKDQADIVWQEAANLAKKSTHPKLKRLDVSTTKPHVHHNIHDRTTQSKFEPLSADRDSGDGVNPYCLIADELHRYKSADLLNMLQESMASRRNRLTIEITTAGWDRTSICYEHDQYSQKVLERTVENETWFAFICRADDEDKENWTDPKVWAKANPSYGVAIQESRVQTAAQLAAELPSKLNDFLRYRLNIWTEQSERAIEIERWVKSGEGTPAMATLRGKKCFGGLDLASNKDLCAFLLIFPTLADVVALAWFWCPEAGILKRSKDDRVPYDHWVKANLIKATPGDTADHRVIKADILKIAQFFDLQMLAFDPHNAGNLPHELADELGEDRLTTFYQGHGNMAAPVKEIERLYLDEKLKHGNNPVLNWMANNAAFRVNEYNEKRFDKLKSTEKIDGMVALAMAIGAWLKSQIEEKKSVYEREGRGLTVI